MSNSLHPALYRIVHKTKNDQQAQAPVLFGATIGNSYPMPWNGGDFQQWKIESTHDGYYKIIQKASGYVLDGNASGQVYLMPWNGGDFQKWRLALEPFGGKRSGTIQQKATQQLLALIGKKQDQLALVAKDSQGIPVNWTLTLQKDQYYQVALAQTVNNKHYVLDGNIDFKVSTRQWDNLLEEKWAFEPKGKGYFKIRNSNSGLVIDSAAYKNGAVYLALADDNSDSQLWRLAAAEGRYLKMIQKSSGKVIDGNNKGAVYLNPGNEGNHFQMWDMQLVEEGSTDDTADLAPMPWGNIGQPAGAKSLNFFGHWVELDADYQLWSNCPGGSSQSAIAAQAFEGKLHTAYEGSAEKRYIWQNVSSDPVKEWPQNTRLDGQDCTSATPSMAVLNGSLYLFFKSDDSSNSLYVSTLENGKWAAAKKINTTNSTDTAPSATTFNEQVFLAYRANNGSGHIRVCKNDQPLESWPQDWPMNETDISDTAPVIISFKEMLYIFYVHNATIYSARSGDGVVWEKSMALKDARNTSVKTAGGVSLCVLQDTLFMVYRNKLLPSTLELVHTNDPSSLWSQSSAIKMGSDDPTIDPSICTFNNRLYLFKCDANRNISISGNGYDLGDLLALEYTFGSNAPTKLLMTAELMEGQLEVETPSLDAHHGGMFCIVKNPNADPLSPVSNEVIAIAGGQKSLVHLRWSPEAKSLADKTGWKMEGIPLDKILGKEFEGWKTDRVEAVYQQGQLLVIITDLGASTGYLTNNPSWLSAKPVSPKAIRSRVLQKKEGGSWQLDPAIHYQAPGGSKDNYGYLRFYVNPRNQQSFVFGAKAVNSKSSKDYRLSFYDYKNTLQPHSDSGMDSQYHLNPHHNDYQNMVMIGEAEIDSKIVVELLATSSKYDLAYTTVLAGQKKAQVPAEEAIFPILLPDVMSYPTAVNLLATHEDKHPDLAIKGKSVLLTDDHGNLAYSFQSAADHPQDSPFTTRLLSGKGLQIYQVAFGKNAEGLHRIFALDLNNRLWLLRQVSEDPDTGEMLFADAFVYLGATLNSISCPEVMVGDAEVYGVVQQEATDEAFLYELHCSKVDKIWVKEAIKVPNDCIPKRAKKTKPTKVVPLYYTEIMAKDDNGIGYANYEMEIRASSRTTVFINGYLHRFDRYSPAYVRTNGQGKVVIESPAKGIATAYLMVHTDFMGVDEEGNKRYQLINPGHNAHRRLSGADGAQLTVKKKGKMVKESFSKDTLYQSGILKAKDKSFSSQDADNLVGLIKNSAAIMANASTSHARRSVGASDTYITNPEEYRFSTSSGNVKRGDQKPVHFTIHLNKGQPSITNTPSSSPQGGKARRSTMSDIGDAIWSWAESAVEEVWDEAKQEFQKIEKLVVEIESEITIMVHTAEGLVQTVVAATVEQVGALVETIFQVIAKAVDQIKDVIEKVVEFLTLLFDWENILKTKAKIETIFKDMATVTTQHILPATNKLFDQYIDQLEDLIEHNFDKLEAHFRDKTFGYSGAQPASNSSSYQLRSEHSVRLNYVSNHYQSSDPGTITIKHNNQSPLVTLLTKEMESFLQLYDQFQKDISKDFQSSSNILDVGILVLLDSAKALVLGLLETLKNLIDTLFQMGEEVLNTFMEWLETEVPILSWLFEIAGIGEVTWLDVFSMMLALPMYVMSELEAASGDDRLKNILMADSKHLSGNPWAEQAEDHKRSASKHSDYDKVMLAIFTSSYIELGLLKTALDINRNLPDAQVPGTPANESTPINNDEDLKAPKASRKDIIMTGLAGGALAMGWMGWYTTIPYKSFKNLVTLEPSVKDAFLCAKSGMILLTVGYNTWAYSGFVQHIGTSYAMVIKKIQAGSTSVLGIANLLLGAGTAWAISTENPVNYPQEVQVLIRPLPSACQGLLLAKNAGTVGRVTALCVPLIDFACDEFVAFNQIGVFNGKY
ncbi:MAG: RICIN domain-containing protein [Bacteroidota bacterium]